jgi:hypothetical protein
LKLLDFYFSPPFLSRLHSPQMSRRYSIIR